MNKLNLVILAGVLTQVALFIAVVWVAVHFISKYW